MDNITRKRRNVYHSHHASSEPTDLAKLRSIYVELAALRSYCDLNQTGFYKIIKKYDKIMEVRFMTLIIISKELSTLIYYYGHICLQEETLEEWMKMIDKQPFATTPEPLQLMDVVTSLVSRAQLIEWGKYRYIFLIEKISVEGRGMNRVINVLRKIAIEILRERKEVM